MAEFSKDQFQLPQSLPVAVRKYPDRGNFRENRFVLAHGSRVQSIVEKSQQVMEAGSQDTPRPETVDAGVQLALFFLFNPGPNQRKQCQSEGESTSLN